MATIAQHGNTHATLAKNDGEYRVRLFINGEYQAGADYFTDSRTDAKVTARHMVENAVESNKSTDFAKAEQADYEEEQEPSIDFIEYSIAKAFLPALINGDETGLTNKESAQLREWVEEQNERARELGAASWHWATSEEEEHDNFKRCEVCLLQANCEEIKLMLLFR